MSNEEEIWKTYPEYDFVEVSNLGRVRTKDRYVPSKNGSKRLVKGRVLKQHPNHNGYMCIGFSVNRKHVNLRVHRMVATCFIPNPNNYPEVNHKDNNPKNNAVSNLEWCSREYNNAYREKYGTPCNHPVFAINLITSKVYYFGSRSEASRKLGVDLSDIGRVVKGKKNTASGYWFTENEREITEEKIQEIKDNMCFLGGVVAINLDTFEVLYFESQREAARQLGASSGNIHDVIKGEYNKTHGYWFTYADENAVEKVRSKFSDEIAKKVEKLISENKKF